MERRTDFPGKSENRRRRNTANHLQRIPSHFTWYVFLYIFFLNPSTLIRWYISFPSSPLVTGEAYLTRFQLKPQPPGSEVATNLYDANINPTVTNEFASAAFRVGHSLIQGIIE